MPLSTMDTRRHNPNIGVPGFDTQMQYDDDGNNVSSSISSETPSDGNGYGGNGISNRKRRRPSEEIASDSDDQGSQWSDGDSQSGQDIAEDDEEDDADLYLDEMGVPLRRRPQHARPSSAFGARGGKGIRRGPRKPVEPSSEFKQLHSDATLAFIDLDYDRAVDLVKQAIHINPEMFAAHSLLSEIFLAQGLKDKALAALFSGAHTRPKDPSVWMKVAELIRERSGEDTASTLQDTVYCYSRVIDIDQKNYDARFQRAAAYRELGHNGRAAQDYERLLIDLPHNTTALRHLAETYIDLNEVDKALDRYDQSIPYYTSLTPDEASDFSWSDVNVYTDLYSYQQEYKQGIYYLRSLARWILGRQDDDEWDAVEDDDREWDAEHSPRRIQTPWFRDGQYPLESYGYGLPLELRVKLGLFRLKLSAESKDEALHHFEWLDPDDTSSGSKLFHYGDLFREAADALKEAHCFQDALRFYIPLQYSQEFADTNLYMAMADCYAQDQNDEDAESCYLTVAEYDPQNATVRVRLAKFYEKMGMADQAMKYVTEAMELGRDSLPRRRRRFGRRTAQLAKEYRAAEMEGRALDRGGERYEDQTTSAPAAGAAPSLTGPMAADTSKDIEVDGEGNLMREADNVRYLYGKLLDLQPAMRAGEEEATEDWLDIADALVRDFRSNRVFFPLQRRMVFLGYSREAQRKAGKLKTTTLMDEVQEIADRLQSALGTNPENEPESIPTDYHGISFDEWLDMFLEYALVLSGQGQAEEVYDTLGAAADASIWYHSKPSTFQIHVCWFTCAIRLDDEETLTSIARWFVKEYQFVTDTYRLFGTLSCLTGDPRKSLFHSSASQKFILRQVKAVDYTVPPDPTDPASRPFIPKGERPMLTTKDESGQLIEAKEMDIALLMLYGHILFTGTSFTNALNYLLRAYTLDPDNPAVLLSVGLSYIHHALKRQAENRHYMIMQGLSFMQEYRRVRETSSIPQEKQEMEFNFARVYHMLGLAHLAIPGYEKCLTIGEEIEGAQISQNEATEKGTRAENFSREAAYALQCLYSFSGELELAKRVTERWLVI